MPISPKEQEQICFNKTYDTMINEIDLELKRGNLSFSIVYSNPNQLALEKVMTEYKKLGWNVTYGQLYTGYVTWWFSLYELKSIKNKKSILDKLFRKTEIENADEIIKEAKRIAYS